MAMDKDEVIRRLKDHLRAKENENGRLSYRDRAFCISYVKDFLEMSTGQAVRFLQQHIPSVVNCKKRNEKGRI